MSNLRLGINYISNAEYHADREYLSSSKLKLILESTEKFHHELSNPPEQQEGGHLDLGTYVHSLVLEPETVAAEYAIFQGFRRAGAAYEAFKLQNPGKKIIALSMQNNGERLAASVQACPSALKLLKGGAPELSIATVLNDVKCKARFDYINVDEGYIVDVKTTRDTSGKEYFKEAVKQYHYDLSAALYATVATAYYKKPFKFYWVVISKEGTPETRTYVASDKTMYKGAKEVELALDKYKKCSTTGIWLDEPTPERATVDEIEEI